MSILLREKGDCVCTSMSEQKSWWERESVCVQQYQDRHRDRSWTSLFSYWYILSFCNWSFYSVNRDITRITQNKIFYTVTILSNAHITFFFLVILFCKSRYYRYQFTLIVCIQFDITWLLSTCLNLTILATYINNRIPVCFSP